MGCKCPWGMELQFSFVLMQSNTTLVYRCHGWVKAYSIAKPSQKAIDASKSALKSMGCECPRGMELQFSFVLMQSNTTLVYRHHGWVTCAEANFDLTNIKAMNIEAAIVENTLRRTAEGLPIGPCHWQGVVEEGAVD
jgi:hypothetical protein